MPTFEDEHDGGECEPQLSNLPLDVVASALMDMEGGWGSAAAVRLSCKLLRDAVDAVNSALGEPPPRCRSTNSLFEDAATYLPPPQRPPSPSCSEELSPPLDRVISLVSKTWMLQRLNLQATEGTAGPAIQLLLRNNADVMPWRTLRHLDLANSGEGFGERGAAALSEMLLTNGVLVHLELAGCEVGFSFLFLCSSIVCQC